MKKILIIIPLLLLFGCGDKESDIRELERRGGTTFHCPVAVKERAHKTARGYSMHERVERADDFWGVSVDTESKYYEPDPWKRAGDTWLITLYPPDRVLIHQRIEWFRWNNGIKKQTEHYFSEISKRDLLIDMKADDNNGLYDFDKVDLNFGRRSFFLFNDDQDEMYECTEIDKTTLSEKIQEHENRLIIDQKVLKEFEEREASKNKI